MARWKERAVAAARGARRFFARENFVPNLKTLLTVVPLTVLVWIYAEQQQLVTEKGVDLRIAVSSADPAHQQLTLLSPADGTISVTLEGSQIGIDRVKQDLAETLLTQPLELSLGGGLPAGTQPLSALNEIVGNKLFYSRGVSVTACSPEVLAVRVDALADREIPVVAGSDVPGLVRSVFTPARVKVRGPTQLLDDLARRGKLTAVADLSGDPTLLQPGEHDKVTAHVTVDPNLTVLPDTVSADLTVGQADATVAVSPVPVKIDVPQYLANNYKFTFKDVLPQPVTLVGPRQQVAMVDAAHPNLVAVIELTNDDHGQESKPVTFEEAGLPDGVHVKADSSPVMVQISIDPK